MKRLARPCTPAGERAAPQRKRWLAIVVVAAQRTLLGHSLPSPTYLPPVDPRTRTCRALAAPPSLHALARRARSLERAGGATCTHKRTRSPARSRAPCLAPCLVPGSFCPHVSPPPKRDALVRRTGMMTAVRAAERQSATVRSPFLLSLFFTRINGRECPRPCAARSLLLRSPPCCKAHGRCTPFSPCHQSPTCVPETYVCAVAVVNKLALLLLLSAQHVLQALHEGVEGAIASSATLGTFAQRAEAATTPRDRMARLTAASSLALIALIVGEEPVKARGPRSRRDDASDGSGAHPATSATRELAAFSHRAAPHADPIVTG